MILADEKRNCMPEISIDYPQQMDLFVGLHQHKRDNPHFTHKTWFTLQFWQISAFFVPTRSWRLKPKVDIIHSWVASIRLKKAHASSCYLLGSEKPGQFASVTIDQRWFQTCAISLPIVLIDDRPGETINCPKIMRQWLIAYLTRYKRI